MPQFEFTNNRPKNYSLWHRTLPSWCYMTDGDYFEQRKKYGVLRAVAYFETIEIADVDKFEDYPVWIHKLALAREIQTKMEIPAFIVWHNPQCDTFVVLNLMNQQVKKFNEQDFRKFLEEIEGDEYVR